MLLNQALLPQPLPWRPSLETNESVPPLRKKGGEVPFRKKKCYWALFKCPHLRGIKRKCQKTASIHSGALYQVTQCGRNEALVLWGNLITPSISSGLLSSTLGLQPPPAGPVIGPETAGWGRGLPASMVFSAFPPSPSQARSMPLCPQGPLPSGHGLNRQGGKGQGNSSALSPVLQQPQEGEPRSQPGSHTQSWRAPKRCLLFSRRAWVALRWLSLPVCGCERSGGPTGLRAE